MRRFRAVLILATATALAAATLAAGPPGAAAPPTVRPATASGAYVLTATDRGSRTRRRSPVTATSACVCRQPGQGYAAGTVPALSEVAGFYAKPSGHRRAATGEHPDLVDAGFR